MSHLFYSLISLIVALFFILFGTVGIIIPWSQSIRSSLIRFILEDSLAISLFGFSFFVVGIAFIIHVVLNAQRRCYYIKSESKAVAVDDQVVQQYLLVYWNELFPEQEIPTFVNVKNNKLHLTIELPYLPVAEQRFLLERIRNDLCALFASKLGYHEEFYLVATFQSNPSVKKSLPIKND